MGVWEDIAKPIISVGAAVLGQELLGPVGAMIGWGVGMGVGGALFPSEAERTSAMSMGPPSMFKPTAGYGMVIPVVRGCRRISGNLIWYDKPRYITDANQLEDYAGWAQYLRDINGGQDPSEHCWAVHVAYGVCHGLAVTLKIYEGKREFLVIGDYAYLLNEGANVPPEYIDKTYAEQMELVLQKARIPAFKCIQYRGDQDDADDLLVESKGIDNVPPYRNLHYVAIHDYPMMQEGVPSLSFEVASLECDFVTPVVHEYTDGDPGYRFNLYATDNFRFATHDGELSLI